MQTILKNRITIAIPTFNRVDKLLARVTELLPQMRNDDILLISDNATAGFNPTDFNILNDKRIIFNINKNNIGGNANFIKCFEFCTTQWLWLLSDDDVVLNGSIEIIHEEIELHPNICFINFSSSILKLPRKSTTAFEGLHEFLKNNDGFGNTLLISNNVFNMDLISKNLSYSYKTCGLNAPHLAPVIKTLEAGGGGFIRAQY